MSLRWVSSTIALFVCLLLVLLAIAPPGQAQLCNPPMSGGGGYLYEVVNGPLVIRDAPSGNRIGLLSHGETFTADLATQTQAGEYLWARHEGGWSALHTLSCSIEFATIVGGISGAAGRSDEPNKCYEWDNCNHPDPFINAYNWRLGWCTAAVERGAISGTAKECAGGAGAASMMVMDELGGSAVSMDGGMDDSMDGQEYPRPGYTSHTHPPVSHRFWDDAINDCREERHGDGTMHHHKHGPWWSTC